MVNEYDRDIERAKKKNLVVYLNGLQDPYFFGEDNTGARWNNADIGKFFAVTAMTLPLDLRVDNINGYWGRIADAAKTAVQEHFRTEAYNLLKTIEHYRKPREESVAMVMSPFRLVEYGAEKVAAYMRNAEQAYPKIFLEDIVHSALALSHGTEPGEEDTDKQIHLLDTVGLAAKKGAQEYVRLKTANDIGRRITWKVHLEYDMILYFLVEELSRRGFIPPNDSLKKLMLDDLAKAGYKRETNGQ